MLPRRCPICRSDLVIQLSTLVGQRTANRFPLYGCFACDSMFNPSGHRENDEGLQNDRDYLAAHWEHHRESARILVGELRDRCPGAHRFLDIGAGVGALVREATAAGLQAEGVELNRYAVEWATIAGVDLRCMFFRRETFSEPFDIVTCNQVLEHLEDPRTLFADAVTAVSPGGVLFVSVPFLPRPGSVATRYALAPDQPGSPFFDNDVHITHFSHKGMLTMARDLGLANAELLEGGLTGYAFKVPS